jgi:hypothetical protein
MVVSLIHERRRREAATVCGKASNSRERSAQSLDESSISGERLETCLTRHNLRVGWNQNQRSRTPVVFEDDKQMLSKRKNTRTHVAMNSGF